MFIGIKTESLTGLKDRKYFSLLRCNLSANISNQDLEKGRFDAIYIEVFTTSMRSPPLKMCITILEVLKWNQAKRFFIVTSRSSEYFRVVVASRLYVIMLICCTNIETQATHIAKMNYTWSVYVGKMSKYRAFYLHQSVLLAKYRH